MKYCAVALNYDKDLETLGMKLTKRDLRFCKHFLCPICQGRKSISNFYRLQRIIKRIEEEDGKSPALILITLTVKNVSAEAFPEAIKKILSGWKKIERKAKMGQIKGYYRSLEVTVPNSNEYHPHLHVLCMVDEDYFKKKNNDYIKIEELVQFWKQSISAEYTPVCYIQRVKGEKGILEVCKYMVKSSDITQNHTSEEIDQIIITLITGLTRRRLISYGGRFKEVNKMIKEEDANKRKNGNGEEELLNLTGRSGECGEYVAEEIYHWDWYRMDYARIEPE